MSSFDENGDLWIEVDAATIPQFVQRDAMSFAKNVGCGFATAVTTINLTRYIRDLIADQTGAVP